MEEHEHEFIQFLAKYRKTYGTKEEYNYRLSVFAEKYYFIKEENASQDHYRLAINKFADMNDYEYKQILSYKKSENFETEEEEDIVYSYPSSYDWRDHGAVTGVKDQGQCGSCWSFSTTGSLEGHNKIKNGNELVSLSEQYFVDCDYILRGGYSLGCNGGDMYKAHVYAGDNGVVLESDYPYTAQDGTCDKTKTRFSVNKGAKYVTKRKEAALLQAISEQPISIGIEAD